MVGSIDTAALGSCAFQNEEYIEQRSGKGVSGTLSVLSDDG
jgi:hypothetical protein